MFERVRLYFKPSKDVIAHSIDADGCTNPRDLYTKSKLERLETPLSEMYRICRTKNFQRDKACLETFQRHFKNLELLLPALPQNQQEAFTTLQKSNPFNDQNNPLGTRDQTTEEKEWFRNLRNFIKTFFPNLQTYAQHPAFLKFMHAYDQLTLESKSKPLIDYIINASKGYQHALLVSGSARQNPCLERLNSYKENAEAPYFCTILTMLLNIVKKEPKESHTPSWKIMKYLLIDSFKHQPEGTFFDRIQQADSAVNEEDKEFWNIRCSHDTSKLILLYTQVHKIAQKYPNANITYNFYDDRSDILIPLLDFISENKNFFPRNVNIRLHRYEHGSRRVIHYGSIQGTGNTDEKYFNHIQLLIRLANNYQPDSLGNFDKNIINELTPDKIKFFNEVRELNQLIEYMPVDIQKLIEKLINTSSNELSSKNIRETTRALSQLNAYYRKFSSRKFSSQLSNKIKKLDEEVSNLKKEIISHKQHGAMYRFFHYLPNVYHKREYTLKGSKWAFLTALSLYIQNPNDRNKKLLTDNYKILILKGGNESETGALLTGAVALKKLEFKDIRDNNEQAALNSESSTCNSDIGPPRSPTQSSLNVTPQ